MKTLILSFFMLQASMMAAAESIENPCGMTVEAVAFQEFLKQHNATAEEFKQNAVFVYNRLRNEDSLPHIGIYTYEIELSNDFGYTSGKFVMSLNACDSTCTLVKTLNVTSE